MKLSTFAGAGLLATLVCLSLPGHAQPLGAKKSDLPDPQIAPGELPRPACNPLSREALRNTWTVASPAVNERLTPSIRGELYLWAEQKLRYSKSTCIEWPFTIGKLQQALGNPVTQMLEMADIDKIQAALDKGRDYRAKQADGRADMEEDRPRSIVDYLPKIGYIADKQCGALQTRAEMAMRDRLNQWGSRNPPGPGRAAAWSAVEREERERTYAVAPAWTEFLATQPALAAWAQAGRCASIHNIKPRFLIEAWQIAAGLQPDATNPQGIERSRELIVQAEARLAEFRGGQDSKLRADAERSGELAKTRRWNLDDIGARSTLAELKAQMPEALCQVNGNKLSCARPVVCEAEQQALGKAQTVSREASAQAQDALQICQNRYRYTAASNSDLLFAGQRINSLELQFDGQGLALMKFGVVQDVEAVRNALTRKYGVPESQQQTRVRTEYRQVGGGTAYTSSGQMVTVAPAAVPVEVQYSVTRYLWKTPKVLVEEVTGAVQFRFAGN